jgi:hypothetical protein
MILPNIAGKLTWKAVSQAAVEIEECLSMNKDFLEIAFQLLTLNSPAQVVQPAPIVQQQPEIEPMELDAMQHSNHHSGRTFSSNRNPHHPGNKKNQDPMRLSGIIGKILYSFVLADYVIIR